jgi:hypothetical protein
VLLSKVKIETYYFLESVRISFKMAVSTGFEPPSLRTGSHLLYHCASTTTHHSDARTNFFGNQKVFIGKTFSLPVCPWFQAATGFEPKISGFVVKYSTTVLAPLPINKMY